MMGRTRAEQIRDCSGGAQLPLPRAAIEAAREDLEWSPWTAASLRIAFGREFD